MFDDTHKPTEALRATAAQTIEDLWQRAEMAGRQERLKAIPNWGERYLEKIEIDAIDVLVNYQAAQKKLTPHAVENAVLKTFHVTNLAQIKAWNFDQVIRYLVADLDEGDLAA